MSFWELSHSSSSLAVRIVLQSQPRREDFRLAGRPRHLGRARAGRVSRPCGACRNADRKAGSGREQHSTKPCRAWRVLAWLREPRCTRPRPIARPGMPCVRIAVPGDGSMCDGLVQAKVDVNQSCGERTDGVDAYGTILASRPRQPAVRTRVPKAASRETSWVG